MARKVVNSGFVLLSRFSVSGQGSPSKTATSHIRKPFCGLRPVDGLPLVLTRTVTIQMTVPGTTDPSV
jgi:hypothetical protein